MLSTYWTTTLHLIVILAETIWRKPYRLRGTAEPESGVFGETAGVPVADRGPR